MKVDWLMLIISSFFVLAIIPFSNILLLNIGENTVNIKLNLIISVLIFSTFLFFFIFLIRRPYPPISSYIWLVSIFIISLYFLKQVEASRDRLHFVGYGILSLLLFRALRHNISTQMLYVISSLFLMLFAILDEVFQIFFPPRNFDIKDIGTDVLSAALGQALIAFVLRPKLESVDVKIRTLVQNLKNLKRFNSRNPN
ncbi:MAG: VanZ family protein [Candidatus Omnitrophota bacterium]